MNRSLNIVSLTACTLVASCGGEPLSGPPELRLGRSACAECGMLISEDRSASAQLLEIEGRREHALFDDVGCMLDAERTPEPGVAILGRWVCDREGSGWLDAGTAAFVLAPPGALRTPMGSGIGAYATSTAAEASASASGGRVMDYAALAAAREGWVSDRFGVSAPSQDHRTHTTPGAPSHAAGE